MALQSLELIIAPSHCFFKGGAVKMASSKEATGSEPERDKKTEASEDSGKPFRFRYVSVHCVKHKMML